MVCSADYGVIGIIDYTDTVWEPQGKKAHIWHPGDWRVKENRMRTMMMVAETQHGTESNCFIYAMDYWQQRFAKFPNGSSICFSILNELALPPWIQPWLYTNPMLILTFLCYWLSFQVCSIVSSYYFDLDSTVQYQCGSLIQSKPSV